MSHKLGSLLEICSLFYKHPNKIGCKDWEYNNFKNDLLRGGFVQLSGIRVKENNEDYIKLIDEQLSLFKHVGGFCFVLGLC
jgi:hypothetical protein